MGTLPSPSLTGRVGDWRAGLGRSLCSLLARSFVCECHTISAVPRFQPPPRRTQHADFPHCALLFASPQGLWDLSASALTYILRLRSCKSMDAFVISSLPSLWSETLQTAGPLRSTGVTSPQRYYELIRHPLAFDRLPGCAGYTIYPAPAISRRGEEGFSSCSACPCHRAVASTPPK